MLLVAHTYEFKRGFATPIIFIFDLRRNVPYFYNTFWVEKITLVAELNDSRCTMVVSGFGQYHRLVHADAPIERAGVIPTPWTMPHMLGFGAILLGASSTCHHHHLKNAIFESMLNYRIIH
jgi:hypothetical protein